MRGKIKYREYARQIKDFSGLRFENITPTDVDGLIEYKNKAYVIIEMKHVNGKLPFGQRLALERLANDLERSKETILIIGKHDFPPDEDIDCASCFVSEYRYKGKWQTPNNITTIREAIEIFIRGLT